MDIQFSQADAEMVQECDKALGIIAAQASRHACAVAALDRPATAPEHSQHALAWQLALVEYIDQRIADAEKHGVDWSYGRLVQDFVDEIRRREVEEFRRSQDPQP